MAQDREGCLPLDLKQGWPHSWGPGPAVLGCMYALHSSGHAHRPGAPSAFTWGQLADADETHLRPATSPPSPSHRLEVEITDTPCRQL